MKINYIALILSLAILPFFAVAEVAPQFTSFAGFELENETSLSEIKQALGQAPLIEQGEAGEYEASICYITPNGILSFLSGEMGGPELTLLGFSVAETTQDSKNHCGRPASGLIPASLSIGGLRLGMTREQFAKLLGGGIQWDTNIGRRIFTGTEPMTEIELERVKKFWPRIVERPYFDVTVSLMGRFRQDKLIEFRVWKVRTT